MAGKLIIFSAPSGSGKTTIVGHLLNKFPNLEFSISATSREPRKGEKNGREYYFMSPEEFRTKIKNDEFVEWEEVYKDHYYGTLAAELERIWSINKHVVFDVDVIGGINLKKLYPNRALSIFVNVPSIEELANRLRKRSTESEEKIQNRLAKAKEEMSYSDQFDFVIMNESLETAVKECEQLVSSFLQNE